MPIVAARWLDMSFEYSMGLLTKIRKKELKWLN